MKLPTSSLKRRQGAFTLVEIMIVITIIVVLAGGAIFLLKPLIGRGNNVRVQQDLDAIELALDSFAADNYYKPPTEEQGLKALVEKPDDAPKMWVQGLESIPLDPWGNEYQYRVPGEKSGKKYDVFSMWEDGVESDDDVGNL